MFIDNTLSGWKGMLLYFLFKFLWNGETPAYSKDASMYIGIYILEMPMGVYESSRAYCAISDCSVGC